MIAVLAGVLALGGLGLLSVGTAPRAARLCAWCVALLFTLVALDPVEVSFLPQESRRASAPLGGGTAAVVANAALGAAAAAGPRAADLGLVWSQHLDDDVGRGPLGAQGLLPGRPLPVDPEQVQVRALGQASVGRPLVLQVEVPGRQGPVEAELTVRASGQVALQRQVQIDGRGAVDCPFTPAQEGTHAVELALQVDDHRIVCRGELVVGPAPRVLVLEPSGLCAAALRAQGVAVEAVDTLPADWRTRPAVVLGQALGEPVQQALVAAVLDGLGLFVLAPAFGGAQAPMRALLPVRPLPQDGTNGAGGGTPAETAPAAPPPAPPPEDRPPAGETGAAAGVSSEPIEVDKRAIALVLVVDRSGSMGNTLPNGHTKMSYAKSSAVRTALALGPGDRAGIVTFGDKGAGRVELPLTDATDLDTVRTGVARLQHAPERTFLLSGLRTAAEMLEQSKAAVKHVVVITDGEFDVGEAVALNELARRMRTQGKTTVSIVSIVDQWTEQTFLREAERLTRAGGGQFLPIDDPTTVPVFVSAEVTRALQRVGREPRDPTATGQVAPPPAAPSPPPEQPPAPEPAPAPPGQARIPVRAVAATRLLEPLPGADWPSLGAAVAGTAPLDAQVLLVAGDAGWPLLAFANRGLGRVGAFAADLCGPAGAEFRAEAGLPARLAQWLQAVLPAEPAREPRALLREATVTPPAPTARDAALLAAIAGAEPIEASAAPAAAPSSGRSVAALAPAWAAGLLAAILLLAVVERRLGHGAYRRGESSAG